MTFSLNSDRTTPHCASPRRAMSPRAAVYSRAARDHPMIPPSPEPSMRGAPHGVERWRGRLRLWSGCVLFTYVTTHFVEPRARPHLARRHGGRAAGGSSRSGAARSAPSRSTAPSSSTSCWRSGRSTGGARCACPRGEATQLVARPRDPRAARGHVVGTRLAMRCPARTTLLSRGARALGARPEARAAPGDRPCSSRGSHGCIGMHFWLRLRPWYPRVRAAAVRDRASCCPCWRCSASSTPAARPRRSRASPAARRACSADDRRPPRRPRSGASSDDLSRRSSARSASSCSRARAAASSSIAGGTSGSPIPAGARSLVPAGFTILEASRLARIPHASVCGGRGRCSTCRVRVVARARGHPRPERRRAARARARGRAARRAPGLPVAPAAATSRSAARLRPRPRRRRRRRRAAIARTGSEQEIAVLFADLRGFTALAERKLPYDVVFFLNRYFEAVGRAIERGGRRHQPVHRRRRDGALRRGRRARATGAGRRCSAPGAMVARAWPR